MLPCGATAVRVSKDAVASAASRMDVCTPAPMTGVTVTVTVMVTSEGKSSQEEIIKNGQEPLLLQGECLLPTWEGLRID